VISKKLASILLYPVATLLLSSVAFAQAPSQWVYYDANHHLQYQTDNQGNRILDFSFAGYQGGGVALPHPPVRATVLPSGGDDTANIQSAIDQVSQLNPDVRGFRGAVLLVPGNYTISTTLKINASGVLLRGSGSKDTVITMAGAPFLGISIAGTGS